MPLCINQKKYIPYRCRSTPSNSYRRIMNNCFLNEKLSTIKGRKKKIFTLSGPGSAPSAWIATPLCMRQEKPNTHRRFYPFLDLYRRIASNRDANVILPYIFMGRPCQPRSLRWYSSPRSNIRKLALRGIPLREHNHTEACSTSHFLRDTMFSD